MKILLFYSYDGSKFCGSQTQKNGSGVEDALNAALSRVGIFERVVSSSRTDKGVHAIWQASSVSCGEFWRGRLEMLKNHINRHASPYIFVKKICEVGDNFQPRFAAKARSYRYIISHEPRNVFFSDYVSFGGAVDLGRLNRALGVFVGWCDFRGFYKFGSGEKSSVREIFVAKAYQISRKNGKILRKNFAQPSHTIIIFKANSFLRAQVRLMVANAIKAAKNNENLAKFLGNFEDLDLGDLNSGGLNFRDLNLGGGKFSGENAATTIILAQNSSSKLTPNFHQNFSPKFQPKF